MTPSRRAPVRPSAVSKARFLTIGMRSKAGDPDNSLAGEEIQFFTETTLQLGLITCRHIVLFQPQLSPDR